MKCERCGKERICYEIHPTNDLKVTAAWCIECIRKPDEAMSACNPRTVAPLKTEIPFL